MTPLDSLEFFKKILSFHSVTPDDGGGFDFIEQYLSDFTCIKIDKNGVKNRFFYKKFSDGAHLCFAGHIDVVPAGEGWNSDPFVPMIDGDTITARGAQDMKSGLSAFLQASKKATHFKGTLSLLLTSDEEGDAKYGTIEALKYLKDQSLLPDFAIVAEPTCEEVFGDTIKIGRRGSINGKLALKGKQGHAAYPKKAINPIHNIAPLLAKIAGKHLDDGDEHFAPSELVITDIRGGMQVTNVTPGALSLMFNVRNSTKTSERDVQSFVASVFEGHDFELVVSHSAKPFRTNHNSKLVQILQTVVQEKTKTTPHLSTAGGTSDARFFGEFGVDTAEFGVRNDKIHSTNESTSIKDVLLLEQIFAQVIADF